MELFVLSLWINKGDIQLAEKILAKDAKTSNIYLTRGGKQIDSSGKECLWGFHPVKILKKVTKRDLLLTKAIELETAKYFSEGEQLRKEAEKFKDETVRVVVLTPWQTELDLSPDYPLEIVDLKTLPTEFNSALIGTTKISVDDEAPFEYIEKLKACGEKKQEEEEEIIHKEKSNKDKIIEELKKGTPIKQIAEKIGIKDSNVYSCMQSLKLKGYKVKKVGKGTFKIVK
jgi:biotin operon repressor